MVGGFWFGTSPNTINYYRAIYTFLDMLGDVGGLLDALKLIAETIVAFTAGNSLKNYIAS